MSSDFKIYREMVLQLRLAQESETSTLEDIIAFCRAALKDYPRERAPFEWAALQNNLANALAALEQRADGTSGLEEAAALYREALKEQTRERAPVEWATIQNNLGLALMTLGERGGVVAKLAEAVAVKREARDWAMRTGDRGVTLMRRAERLGNQEMARMALHQIDVAFNTIRDGDLGAVLATHYEEQLPKARALVERLSEP